MLRQAQACAKELFSSGLLESRELLAPQDRKGKTAFYVSDRAEDFEQTASRFLQEDMRHAAKQINIEQY